MRFLKEIPRPKERLFAIGDIHGCVSELQTLLKFLEVDEKLSTNDQLIFIGDYIDRGPDSRAVIDLLLDFRKRFPETIFLKGNHEDMLLHHCGLPGTNGDVYIKNGGGPTLKSYSIPELAPAAEVLSGIPQDHIEFYKGLDSLIQCGDFLFAHAGLNPRRGIRRQVAEDLYWIREGFLEETHSFGKPVVFGHTPHAEVIFDLPWKIGIDTGLVYGNMLTCIDLWTRRLLQVPRQSTKVYVSPFPAWSEVGIS